MTTRTTTRKKKTSGSRERPASVARLLLGVLVLLAMVTLAPASAGAADKKKPQQDPVAIIAGTVFRDPGFALPGARVTLAPAGEAEKSRKVKKLKAVSDPRGEFAFRVPADAGSYTLTAEADGYRSEVKTAEVQAGVRTEVYFTLQPVAH
jgi:hypothetical protein